MTFDMIQTGDRVFIDANIFLYHFGEASAECKVFLTRCSNREIMGYTSTSVLAEVLHRAMLIEAVKKGYITARNPVQQLKKHPDIITQLSQYTIDVDNIFEMEIAILALTKACLETSRKVRQTEGLLTNDSLLAATMKNAGISKLATHDNDFDHISWLEIYKPTDVRPS